MEIKGTNEKALEAIEMAKKYKTMMFEYVFLALCSAGLFLRVYNSFYIMVIFIISIGAAMFMYYNFVNLQDRMYEQEDCYIKLSDTYLEFRQLINGEYQIGKIFINDIKRVMKVENGFQIWIDKNAENSRYMIDDDIIEDIETMCIDYYSFDSNEYIKLYLEFLKKLPEETEKELDVAEWKEHSVFTDNLKLLVPSFLYAIAIILIFI